MSQVQISPGSFANSTEKAANLQCAPRPTQLPTLSGMGVSNSLQATG